MNASIPASKPVDRLRAATLVVLVVIAAELGVIAYQGSVEESLQRSTVEELTHVCNQINTLRADTFLAAEVDMGHFRIMPC